MEDFFSMPGFGSELADATRKTSKRVQGQPVYEVTSKNPPLRKGDQIYLDNAHNDHLEVFDKFNDVRLVLNFDGSVNQDKTDKAKAEKRKLR
ncbi:MULTISPECIES: hypothetical protein [unclassified Pseudomonas]|uniref:hypothetical protein n=1 Tax=unclassified Pseudomonas TaxID=196821 RepID=UPI000A1EC629|nr:MULTISPECIES: hypothetical protein [unclassified Pseudomonas]